MRYVEFFAMAFAGMTAGLVAGLLFNGLTDTGVTFALGAGGAILLPMIQIPISIHASSKIRKAKASKGAVRQIPRFESEGSFAERLERFASHVNHAPAKPADKPARQLWAAADSGEYKRTPPRPVSLFRMLLTRIRRALAQH